MEKALELKLGEKVEGVALSGRGELGAAVDKCGVLHRGEKCLTRVCGKGETFDVSFNKNFAFINTDGRVFVVSPSGELLDVVKVGEHENEAVLLLEDGLVACSERCSLYRGGEKVWEVELGHVASSPARVGNVIYVPDEEHGKLFIIDLKEGNVVKELPYGEFAYSVDACNKYLLVGTASKAYLYELEKPEEPKQLLSLEGFEGAWAVAIAPSCDKFAVADASRYLVRIFDMKGNELETISFEYPGSEEIEGTEPTSLDWKDYLAIGLRDGRVALFKQK